MYMSSGSEESVFSEIASAASSPPPPSLTISAEQHSSVANVYER
jgi:hypothetical protein